MRLSGKLISQSMRGSRTSRVPGQELRRGKLIAGKSSAVTQMTQFRHQMKKRRDTAWGSVSESAKQGDEARLFTPEFFVLTNPFASRRLPLSAAPVVRVLARLLGGRGHATFGGMAAAAVMLCLRLRVANEPLRAGPRRRKSRGV